MAWSNAVASALSPSSSLFHSSPSLISLLPPISSSTKFPPTLKKSKLHLSPSTIFSISSRRNKQLCRAAEYQFPDPIPEFAEAETEKFKAHLLTKLEKKDIYGGSVQDVLGICTEIFSTFVHTEYGGPGTLLVVPFIDMAETINERGLPGGPQAARSAVVWAQKHLDKDWNEWTGSDDN